MYNFSPTVFLFHIGIFLLGLCVGSFVNVCIWRIPREESIIFPPSHCPKCGHNIAWHDNIPLLSWLLLKGKCRYCNVAISPRYFFIELLTAVCIFILWIKLILFSLPIYYMLLYVPLSGFLISVFFIDYEHRIIPDKLNYSITIIGLLLLLIFPDFWISQNKLLIFWIPRNILYNISRFGIFTRACAGMLLAGLFFAFCAVIGEYIFKREALGWGDVKYIAAIGGIIGIPGAFFTIFIGSLLGSIFGILRILYYHIKNNNTEHTNKEDCHAIPFGPFLALATYIWLITGDIISHYIMLYNMR